MNLRRDHFHAVGRWVHARNNASTRSPQTPQLHARWMSPVSGWRLARKRRPNDPGGPGSAHVPPWRACAGCLEAWARSPGSPCRRTVSIQLPGNKQTQNLIPPTCGACGAGVVCVCACVCVRGAACKCCVPPPPPHPPLPCVAAASRTCNRRHLLLRC